MKTSVYSSDKQTHFFQELKDMFTDIKSSNFLAFQLAKRDLQSQYRQSFLGFFWAFAPIITNSLVWIFLNNSGTVNVNSDQKIPYVLFVVIGTTVWSIFTESMMIPLTSVNSARSILSKINFPKEALLISGIYKLGFNLGLKLLMIALFLVIYSVKPGIEILYFPFILISIMCLSMSIGLLITPLGLIYTDIAKVITTAIPFLMYFTPVVYAVPQQGFFKKLFELNPLTFLFNDARNALVGISVDNLNFALIVLVISSIILLIGLVIFRKSMPIIIEKIGG
ncbi:lipopolysaccharide transport system permease protein [Halpernia humi]|uniref:Transport permease protein n=1 Tax=Halpernia humi TaxID=493375 RepID=A0A1H5W640_9FLAO|nr:ABC transporter permease [Halpernia humi]SEF94267.1 lipopolysaccharide transport system permease protein [Halpernia humi]